MIKIKEQAGKLRGVRVYEDPNGVLLSPFVDVTGVQYGYVLIPMEEAPAVYDGSEWHPIFVSEDGTTWEEKATEIYQQQVSVIAAASSVNPKYAQLFSTVTGQAVPA